MRPLYQNIRPCFWKGGQGFLDQRSSTALFPAFNLTFKSLNMMKPSPQSHGFIYENQTPSAISDQEQQPSGRVTKAEQEKPLTANHCIDRQASPPLPADLNLTPPSLPTNTHAYSNSSAFTTECTHIHGDVHETCTSHHLNHITWLFMCVCLTWCVTFCGICLFPGCI